MAVFQLILLVLAFVLFIIAAAGVPTNRFSTVAGGLAAWSLAEILGKV